MSKLIETTETCLASCRAAETDLALVQRFMDDGGAFRLTVRCDHADEDVREAVERLARRFIPGQTMANTVLRGAMANADAAERELREVVQKVTPISASGRAA